MEEKCYFISEASKLVGVETHVLRYWEEQLDLTIRRNEMGHRYYIEEDIRLLQNIRQIMEKGIQLRAVKMMLPSLLEHREDTLLEMMGVENMCQENTIDVQEEGTNDMTETGTTKIEMEREAVVEMNKTDKDMRGNNMAAGQGSSRQVVMRQEPSQQELLLQKQTREERMAQFQEIMSGLIGQALRENSSELAAAASDQVSERVIKEMDYLMRMRESQEEEHFKKLDETIRDMQRPVKKRHLRRQKRKDCK